MDNMPPTQFGHRSPRVDSREDDVGVESFDIVELPNQKDMTGSGMRMIDEINSPPAAIDHTTSLVSSLFSR